MSNPFQDFTEKVFVSLETGWNTFVFQIPGIILAILIIAVGIFVAGKIAQLTSKTLSRKTSDPLMVNFLTKTIRISFILLFLMYALRVAGLGDIATALLTAAGASAIIIGFAFKDIGENFISGVILAFNRPFHIHDTVSIGDIFGKVTNMEFRYTKLKTFDGRDVYIPNSDVIRKPVFNYTEDGYYRLSFNVGIAYEDKIEDAEKLILETVQITPGVIEDDNHENFIAVDELAVSTVNLKVNFWVNTLEYRREARKIRGNVIRNVKEALEANGFGLPADIKEIKLYGSQTSIPVRITHEEGSTDKKDK